MKAEILSLMVRLWRRLTAPAPQGCPRCGRAQSPDVGGFAGGWCVPCDGEPS